MRARGLFILLGGLAGNLSAIASSPDAGVPIVLSPSRLAQDITESPSAVTVLDRQLIAATGARKLIDVLRLVPGMTVGSAYGNLPSVGHHGLSDSYARRIQVLVDGRSTWQPATGGVFWLNLPVPIEDIDRIEVIRGPNAASFGSSAFQATVNIFTRHSSEATGPRVGAAVGTDGIDDRYVHFGGQSGALGVSVSASRQHDSGYDQLHDTRRDDALFTRLDYTPTLRDELSAEAGFSHGKYQAGTGDFFNPQRHIRQRDDFQYLRWIRARQGGDELKVALSRNHFENIHAHPVGPIPSPPVGTLLFDYGYEVTRYDAEFQHTLAPSERLRAVWGLGLRRDEVQSEAYFDTAATQENDYWRAFSHLEYRFTPRTLLNAGFMVEDSEIMDPEFSPRAAVIHHPAPGHSLRLAMNTGTRVATLWENQARQRFANEEGSFTMYKTISSGVETVEKAVSYDLGHVYRPHAGLTVDSRVYYEQVSDLITQFLRDTDGEVGYYPGSQVLDFRNQDDVEIVGFETQGDLRLTSRDRLFVSYAYTEIIAGDGAEDLEASAPRQKLALLLSHDFTGGLEGSIFYTWQDRMAWLDGSAIDACDRLDLRLARRWRVDNKAVRLELVGQNLSGAHADYRRDARWEPLGYVRLSVDF